MNTKTFTTWMHKGVRFLAVDNGSEAHITDENGSNYGSWMGGEKEFRKRQIGGEIFDSFGCAIIRVVPSRS